MLGQFLSILKDIEDGKLDESDGSYKVGSILKKIYIDSAIQKNENMEKQKNKKTKETRFRKREKRFHGLSLKQ